MNIFENNIASAFGAKGRKWLADLPALIAKLADDWSLKEITPVENMTFNYVATAITKSNQSVVLKMSCDEKNLANEVQALECFAGNGAIQVISYHTVYHALLLQQAVPGVTLKSLYPAQVEYVMDCYIATMKKLHSTQLAKNNFRHIRDWLVALDHLSENVCSSQLIHHARTLKNKLLSSLSREVFLHGDLHHDNILQHGDQWLAIDPKGVIGELEFEIAAFDFMYIDELASSSDVKYLVGARINVLAQKAQLSSQRIKDWMFVRLLLMAAWRVEDGGNPESAIKLAAAIV